MKRCLPIRHRLVRMVMVNMLMAGMTGLFDVDTLRRLGFEKPDSPAQLGTSG